MQLFFFSGPEIIAAFTYCIALNINITETQESTRFQIGFAHPILLSTPCWKVSDFVWVSTMTMTRRNQIYPRDTISPV